MNELPTVSTTIKFLLYADDSNILYKHSDLKTIISTINAEMPRITEWFQSNKLQINSRHVFMPDKESLSLMIIW